MNYIKEIRALIGNRPLLLPVAAVILLNEKGEVLLQRRRDNGLWGLNGGALDVGESAEDAARREVFEETGLTLGALEWFQLFSGPEMMHTYPNGDVVSIVAALYIARDFQGEIQLDPEEVMDVRYFDPFNLPTALNPPARPIFKAYCERFVQTHSSH